MKKETWRLVAHGRVQGVGYRAACADAADDLELGGWVRNRLDGTVEVMAHGTVRQLEALQAWMEQGPPAAQVTLVEVGPGEGEFAGFEFRPTI
ncbi:acylphosphatase [Cupriavidus necator]|uniref:Acylphosphatase n=2 Tax=Cupriavidus necator (strain ATCC 17699 / DSM 428 / KCTC 22496 / NCIMB 10442 / H16 / Stanier 337) TaxID=381666 RepID=ACYP_CUPNH|nr:MULTISPECIES: acylphosphatase [Cupriavidus]Q0K6H7.1 RecName: Full=Acylphosphatase; AltName: Full=Acylphosphate phosphohydrolase [Cupriavidus necator H16]EON20885.1 acylphosphatase [Cupriavidus sp. GA3-3]KUE86827.1 acylphosphatase [Cupriavidus necator]QCC02149.1 acylphosphatase [Cupriavidus necator H16]QQB78445.1 acylphosphatase [Cupriavidus necator]WKA40552.1 acylphosphatase [Cupriavidus necator]